MNGKESLGMGMLQPAKGIGNRCEQHPPCCSPSQCCAQYAAHQALKTAWRLK